jgi:hypothetical protein
MVMAGVTSTGNVKPVLVDPSGRPINSPERQITPMTKYATLSATTETILWTPTTGKKWVITDIVISSTATTLVTFRDGSAGTTFMIGRCTASYPFVSNQLTPIVSAGINRNLTVQSSVITAYVTVTGYEE